MKFTPPPVFFFVAGATASLLTYDQILQAGCCGQISVQGGAKGITGQLADGQIRVGGGYPPSTYCFLNGTFTDSTGKGCIVTPWEKNVRQFQCDLGKAAQPGFTLGPDGRISFNGVSTFWACPATPNGELNVYTSPVPGQLKCITVNLTFNGTCGPTPTPPKPNCASSPACGTPTPATPKCSSSPACGTPKPPVSTPSPKPSSLSTVVCNSASPCKPSPSTASIKPCQSDLAGRFEFPHLVVPIDKNNPDKPIGNQLNGYISNTISTIFNFDIPRSYAGQTCSLVFLFPRADQLETSNFGFNGQGKLTFSKLTGPATTGTTWSKAPAEAAKLATISARPGNGYVVASFPCPAGQKVGFKISGSDGLELWYFQDFNPKPIGLYITTC